MALRICHTHCTVILFVMTSAKTSLTSLSWYAHDVDGGGVERGGGGGCQSINVSQCQSVSESMKVLDFFDCLKIVILDLCKMSFIVVVCVIIGDRVQVASTFVTVFGTHTVLRAVGRGGGCQ